MRLSIQCATRRAAPLAMALAVFVAAPVVDASEHKAPPEKGAHGEAGAEEELVDQLSLGTFDLHDFHPTHKKTPHIQLALTLVLDAKTTPAQHHDLANWKRRLRDQTIIAIRSAEPYALAEPGLNRVERLILLRIRRLELPAKVTSLLITDFSVTDED